MSLIKEIVKRGILICENSKWEPFKIFLPSNDVNFFQSIQFLVSKQEKKVSIHVLYDVSFVLNKQREYFLPLLPLWQVIIVLLLLNNPAMWFWRSARVKSTSVEMRAKPGLRTFEYASGPSFGIDSWQRSVSLVAIRCYSITQMKSCVFVKSSRKSSFSRGTKWHASVGEELAIPEGKLITKFSSLTVDISPWTKPNTRL